MNAAGQRALVIAGAWIGWTAVGIVFAMPMLGEGADWRRQLLQSWSQWWAWGLLAPLIARADRALPLDGRQLGPRLAAHVPIGIAFTALSLYLTAALRLLLLGGDWGSLGSWRLLAASFRGAFIWNALIYCLILGGWLALAYYRRYLAGEARLERLERLSTEARLHALRLQLDPHFLFNALNTISAEVESDPRLARRMLEHVGDLLRLTLENKDRHAVPLAEELAFLDHYLAIQRIRFGDRIRFEVHCSDEVRPVPVPALSIQPLVENAIRHGLAQRASGGWVRVEAVRQGEALRIRVEDDGVGLPAGWPAAGSEGLGLSVTRQRVAGMYPEGGSRFSIRPRAAGGGVEVEMLLPIVAPEAA